MIFSFISFPILVLQINIRLGCKCLKVAYFSSVIFCKYGSNLSKRSIEESYQAYLKYQARIQRLTYYKTNSGAYEIIGK
jgi:hypothetical protein